MTTARQKAVEAAERMETATTHADYVAAERSYVAYTLEHLQSKHAPDFISTWLRGVAINTGNIHNDKDLS